MNSQTTRKRPSPTRIGCAVFAALIIVGAGLTFFDYVWANRDPDIVVPPRPAAPAPNGFDDFAEAGRLAAAIKHRSPIYRGVETPTVAAMTATAKDAMPAMVVLHAGVGKPSLSPSPGDAAVNRTYDGIRELMREVLSVAMYYDHLKQVERATDTLLDGIELTSKLPRGGGVDVSSTERVFEAYMVVGLEVNLEQCSPAFLIHVASRLDAIRSERVPYDELLQEDTYAATNRMLAILHDPNGPRTMSGARALIKNGKDDGSFGSKMSENLRAFTIVMSDKRAMAHAVYDVAMLRLAEARKPYGAGVSIPMPDNPFAPMFEFGEVQGKCVAMNAVMELLRTECALYRYRAAHGRLPERLDELVPALLPAVPVDPCSTVSAPLRYRVANAGKQYLLYSIGPDRVDDGGSAVSITASDPGDLVVGQLLGKGRLGATRNLLR